MLISYDFSTITSLKLGSERIEGNDSISPAKIRSLLGVIPPRVSGKNVSLMWLYSNIDKCEIVATGTQMFMLIFIGTLLCLELGSTMSLYYLGSLRDINRIKNYDWGVMAHATLLHIMTRLSQRSLSSLGGAPFVWQVRLKFLVRCVDTVFCPPLICMPDLEEPKNIIYSPWYHEKIYNGVAQLIRTSARSKCIFWPK